MKQGLFVGLSTIDVVYRVEDFPKPNAKIVATSQDAFVGGPATNAAVTYAYLGGDALLATVVGSNRLAHLIRDEAQTYRIRLLDLNETFAELPPVSSIMVSPSGDRTIVSANATRVPSVQVSIDSSIIEKSSVILIDGHYMQACIAWAQAGCVAGIPVVFDGGSWKPRTEDLLHSVHTAICSANFIPPGCASKNDVIAFLRQKGVRNIAITDGPHSILYARQEERGSLPVTQVESIDTMGAGDILHGAFCFHISQGHGFVDSLGAAAHTATESCKHFGPRAWMKDYKASAVHQLPRTQGPNISPRSTSTREGTADTTSDSQGVGVPDAVMEKTVGKPAPSVAGSTPEPVPTTDDPGPVDPQRRRFIAAFILAIPGAVGGTVTTYRFIAEQCQKRQAEERARAEREKAGQELRELRACYLLPVFENKTPRCRLPIIPGMKDPWGPPERRFSGSGNTVMQAYLNAFGPWQYDVVPEMQGEVMQDDAPVVIASHLVNELAQSYFGDPASPSPIFSPQYKDSQGRGFEASLRWTIYTPSDAETLTRKELFEGKPTVRKSVRHLLADCDEPQVHRTPVYTRQGETDVQQNDYLLVTVLPRDSRFDRRMVSMAGVSKCGTLAAGLLFQNDEPASKLLKEIDGRVRGCDYYQALIKINVSHHLRGNPQPVEPVLIDATPIKVTPL